MAHTCPKGFMALGDAFQQTLFAKEDLTAVLNTKAAHEDEIRPGAQLAEIIDRHDAIVRRVETLMRETIADGDLPVFVRGPNGQIEQIIDREEWRQSSFGIPGIESVPHHLINPGPDTDGQPWLLKISDFKIWLKKHRPNSSGRVGPPMKYDWPDAKSFAMKLLNERGEFKEWDSAWKVQADLEQEVLSYMEKSTGEGEGPGESTLRGYVSIWLAEWLRPKAVAEGQ